jgi:monovalent cation:H+ antiporter-2, CPA2 family
MAIDHYLTQLLVLAGVAVIGAILLARMRLPVVTVLLVAGALVGPTGFGLVQDVHQIEILAHIGVVLLLFTIGLEFSVERLLRIGRLVALGGSLQAGLTVAAVTGLFVLVGDTVSRGIFFGFVVALSSTAIVLRSLSERNEVDAPHGRFILGALLFQDLAFVPMMLLVPVLAGQGDGNPFVLTFWALGKAAVTVVVTFVVARVLVPRLLAQADKSKSREVFLLSVLCICIGTAWITSLAGLSLELGAFLAGIVLADSEYAHRAEADILPLRDVLTSLFFMSLGMLFDFSVVREHPGTVAIVFAVLFLGKGFIATLASLAMRMPARVAVLAGIGLAQFGEFGFVVALAGARLDLMSAFETKVLFSGAILTMVITPIAIRLGPFVAEGAARLPGLSASMGAPDINEPAATAPLSGHIVIVGYGVAGRTLATALKETGTPYLILELNAETVRNARAAGEPAFYGDIGSATTMEHARVADAQALVLLINDARAAERGIVAARHQAPTTPVFVRTKFLSDAERLRALGASEVVVEEVEAGLEMLARSLRHAGVPRNVIMRRLEHVRDRTFAGQREPAPDQRRLAQMPELEGLQVDTALIGPEDHAVGRSVIDLQLRGKTGANLVAIRRNDALIERDLPKVALQPDDLLFLVGSPGALRRSLLLLETGRIPTADDDRSSMLLEV